MGSLNQAHISLHRSIYSISPINVLGSNS